MQLEKEERKRKSNLSLKEAEGTKNYKKKQ